MKLYWLQFLMPCERCTIVLFLTAALLLPKGTASAQGVGHQPLCTLTSGANLRSPICRMRQRL